MVYEKGHNKNGITKMAWQPWGGSGLAQTRLKGSKILTKNETLH